MHASHQQQLVGPCCSGRFRNEAVYLRVFSKDLVCWFSCTMTCLDADLAENGVCLMGAAAAHSVLELGEKLERVQGNDAVVMISRKKQHGRILDTL